jgi:hypothetical protein
MIRLRSTNVRTDNVLKKFSFTNALFLVSRASSRITGLFAYHGPVAHDWLLINRRARPLRVSWACGP